MMTPRRYGLLLAGALSLVGLPAMTGCGDEDSGERPGNQAADAASDDGEEVGEALAEQAEDMIETEPPSAALAHLGGIIIALDHGEVAQAVLALDRAGDPVVLDYAARMSDEHAAHADRVEDLLASRGASPQESSVSGTLRMEAYAGIGELRATPRHDLDFAYMRLQVKMHAAGGVLINRLFDVAPDDGPLHALLQATRDAIAAHRSQAESILRSR